MHAKLSVSETWSARGEFFNMHLNQFPRFILRAFQCVTCTILLPVVAQVVLPNIHALGQELKTNIKSVPIPLRAKPQEKNPAQLLSEQNKKFESLDSFSRVLNLLENGYVDSKSVVSEELVERAIKGMVSGLDPHTVYLPASQLRDFTSDTSGKFGGIGVVISQVHGRLEIVEVIENSPAARAGIVAGDTLYAIEDTIITSKNLEKLLDKLKGIPGSLVKVEVVSPSEIHKLGGKVTLDELALLKPRTRKVTITREIIRTNSVAHAKLDEGYAYIKLAVFQEDAAEQVEKALKFYENQNANKTLSGVVFDLRNNPGGLVDQAVKICDMFLDSGIIVSTVGRDKSKQEVEYASKKNTHPFVPMVLLVNEGSASASEIVAGAFQDHNRAVLMGHTTFGKGSVQTIIQLPNGGGLKMTIARYFTPKGRSIQAKGIIPDVSLDSLGQKKEQKNIRKEADLVGHIEPADLLDNNSTEVSRNAIPSLTTLKNQTVWPDYLQKDEEVKMAFQYLKGVKKLEPR
jgi:carboxyl-terminal processing protease